MSPSDPRRRRRRERDGARANRASERRKRGSEGQRPALDRTRGQPRRAARASDERGRARPRGADLRKGATAAGKPLLAGLGEILAIGREMLAIPASMALGLAERLGLLILAAWRFLWPILLAAAALARRGIEIAARELTPARALAAVLLVAAALLAISQFLDYREVRAGVPAYAEVEEVAPAPQVSGTAETAGSAHAYLLAVVAVAIVALVVLSMLGRWRLAKLIPIGGLVAVAVAVLVDAPNGLDEGIIAIQFQGAEARLLGPFWVQLAAGAVIAVCGVLFALAVRPQGARRRAQEPRRSRGRRARLGSSRVEGARS